MNLETAVERLPGCVPRGVWQGESGPLIQWINAAARTTRRNSDSIPTSCNAGRRRAGRAPGVVARVTQQVSARFRKMLGISGRCSISERSIAVSRIICKKYRFIATWFNPCHRDELPLQPGHAGRRKREPSSIKAAASRSPSRALARSRRGGCAPVRHSPCAAGTSGWARPVSRLAVEGPAY